MSDPDKPKSRATQKRLLPDADESQPRLTRLRDLEPGELGDCFAVLASRESANTRDGKPYFRVGFRDAVRTVTCMIWRDSGWFEECEANWRTGRFYKLRVRYFENQYGPQIELDRIREVVDADKAEGFDPHDLFRSSRYDPRAMFDELLRVALEEIGEVALRRLVVTILESHAEALASLPAASRNHHAFAGGFLEHVLSVTKTALHLADKYVADYSHLHPPLSKSLVVAGAILHDIGKLRELAVRPEGADYTAAGRLVGHILLGRDIVREAAAGIPELGPETLLRLEHIIVSHQNLPEWGSPIAPHTPEALLVHYADDIDAKFQMMAAALDAAPDDAAEFTSRTNPMHRAIFRGLHE